MISASRAYQACRDLFDAYPLAVNAVLHIPTMHSMVLMLRDGANVRFFVLLRDCGDSRPAYSLIPWDADGIVAIEDNAAEVPDVVTNTVTRGIPIPRDGSLFGWIHGAPVTGLIVVYARQTTHRPVPSWSVMPLVGAPEAEWPPFTDERLFGPWFWEHYRAGNVSYLGDVVAAAPDTVFWVDMYEALGSDCCVVARDLKTPDGHILTRGTYLDSAALRAGAAVPTMAELLADVGKTDLAPLFQVPARC